MFRETVRSLARSAARRCTALAVLILVLFPVSVLAIHEPHRSAHIRTKYSSLHALVDDGRRQSPAFERLVERLDESDVVVYLECGTLPPGRGGELGFLGVASGTRYLKVTLACALRPETLTWLMGHELQHAVEIARAPEVVDVNAMRQLYRRIGVDVLGNGQRFDTQEAINAGTLIRQQLWAAPENADADDAGGRK